MSCVITLLIGVAFIYWNINALEVNPQAYSHLLLACASGFALTVYLIRYLINLLTEPQHCPYYWKD
jgi:hypothetical protein